MKPEQLLNQVSQLMANPPFSISDKWYLIPDAKDVVFVPTSTRPIPETIFAIFTRKDLNRGLTPNQWRTLKRKLYNYLYWKAWL